MIYIGYPDHEKRSIISQYEAAHGITKTVVLYPALFPLPIEHADAVEYAPTPLLFYVYQIIMSGEVPEDRPNVSGVGQNGASIRRSTAKTTRPSNADRPRLVNG